MLCQSGRFVVSNLDSLQNVIPFDSIFAVSGKGIWKVEIFVDKLFHGLVGDKDTEKMFLEPSIAIDQVAVLQEFF